MRIPLSLRVIFMIMLAFTVNIFVYFSFGNIYSSKSFNYEQFVAQYTNGVYQYRFLSTQLLIGIHQIIEGLPFLIPIKTYFWESNGEPNMLIAFAALNTLFLCLCGALMTWIMDSEFITVSESEKITLPVVGVFAIALTHFVIVPYDNSSYFFILLFILAFLNYLKQRSNIWLAVLVLIIIVSTLNRESSALSLSFAGALLYYQSGIGKKSIVPIIILALCFIAIYFGMRLYYGSFSTNDGNLLWSNLTQMRNYFGLLFWVVFFALSLIIAINKRAIRIILIFHIFSLPYIIMLFYTGILYETRLYIPILITSLILSKLNLQTENKLE